VDVHGRKTHVSRPKIEEKISSASWIRKMFDQGQQLKAQYGNDKVFDFTLGNPYPEPRQNLRKL
jgi:aspartate aminotransferase